MMLVIEKRRDGQEGVEISGTSMEHGYFYDPLNILKYISTSSHHHEVVSTPLMLLYCDCFVGIP